MRFRETMMRRLRARPLLKSIRQVRIAASGDYWDHYYQETYKGYRIDYFPNPNVYGIYVGTADPETIPKAPPDPDFDTNDWNFYGDIKSAEGAIDTWVAEPLFVQLYPNVTWETHVDPGWDIFQEGGGAMRYYAIDKATGKMIGTYWPSDNLQGLLDWIDENFVPTGVVVTYKEIPIEFYLEGWGWYYVYYANVEGHGKRFDDWRLGDCKAWIDKETTIYATLTDLTSPLQGAEFDAGESFTIGGYLLKEETGEGQYDRIVDVLLNGVKITGERTDETGYFSRFYTIEEPGSHVIGASFEGSRYLAPSEDSVEITIKEIPPEPPEPPKPGVILKNVVELYEEFKELGFTVRWIIPNRSFVVEGGTLRYTGPRLGRKTYVTTWLLTRA